MAFDAREYALGLIQDGHLDGESFAQMCCRWIDPDSMLEMLEKNEYGPNTCDDCECVIDDGTGDNDRCDDCQNAFDKQEFIDNADDGEHDIDKLSIDIENDNFDIDYDDVDDYLHDTLIQNAVNNGQFSDAREMCDEYGKDISDYWDGEDNE